MLKLQAFGDCNTEGSEKLPPGECVPTKLQQQLTELGFDVSLENHGGTMNCSREGLSRSQDNNTAADLVLINYGLVDSWHTSLPQLYVPYYPNGPLSKWGRKVLKSLKRRLRSPWIRKILPVGPVVTLEEFRQNITSIISDVRQRNQESVIILWSTVPVRDDAARNLLIADYNRCLQSLANEHDCEYFAVEPLILNRDELYLDNVHMNGDGASVVARQVIQALRNHSASSINASRAA